MEIKNQRQQLQRINSIRLLPCLVTVAAAAAFMVMVNGCFHMPHRNYGTPYQTQYIIHCESLSIFNRIVQNQTKPNLTKPNQTKTK